MERNVIKTLRKKENFKYIVIYALVIAFYQLVMKEYYGDKCIVYNGKMSAKQKDAARDKFMEDPNTMVFIGNIIAAGVVLNLTVSHIMVFNNIDFVPGNDRQMEDRIYRIGQKHDVDIYYQMFNDTQYVKIWNTVIRKELSINQVIKKENEK